MVSVTLATSEWIQFFKDAGIPAGPAVNYAVSFVDNRIQKNMLMDLTKDIMNELGITAVGDIIAILKHAKVVYKQELAKMATESINPSPGNVQFELKRTTGSHAAGPDEFLQHIVCVETYKFSETSAMARTPAPAASRMITNSLSRESPPSTPLRRPETTTSKISVTVANKLATKKAVLSRPADPGPDNSVKRRRVTAEMEGKYIINMPKGTTAKTKKILEQQATKGLPRTSVFDRLGAETKADTTTGSKPTGVFSRLGEVVSQKESSDDDEAGSVLQYAGVLKRAPTASAQESPALPLITRERAKASATTIRRLAVPKTGSRTVPGKGVQTAGVVPTTRLQSASQAKVSIRHRLGKPASTEADTQDNKVSSTKSRGSPEFTVTIKNMARTAAGTKVTSSTEGRLAQMDSTAAVSVFERLGKKLK